MSHVDTTQKPAHITHVSLCAGYGGIDLALDRIFGRAVRTIAFSEIEAFAIENLVAKMEAGEIPPAPVWTDLRTFPWGDFDGIDILSGGFPCQPFSAAGRGDADSDPRHLFPAILEGIRIARPAVVFLENVEGIISKKLKGDGWRDPAGTPVLLHVLRELERVGYRAEAGIFSAAEVGAPHQRKRTFIVGHSKSDNQWRKSIPAMYGEGEPIGGSSSELAYRECAGLKGGLRGWPNTEWESIDGYSGCGSAGIHRRWPARPGEPQHEWEAPRVC